MKEISEDEIKNKVDAKCTKAWCYLCAWGAEDCVCGEEEERHKIPDLKTRVWEGMGISVEAYADALVSILKERLFWTANRKEFDREGFSASLDEFCAIRDVNYREAVLYETPEKAIEAAVFEEIEHLMAMNSKILMG